MTSDIRPVSFAQESRLFYEELAPTSGVQPPPLEFPIAVRLSGPLDKAALREAIETVVARHAALRAAYVPVTRYSRADRRVMLDLFGRSGAFVSGFFGQVIGRDSSVDITWRTDAGPAETTRLRMAEHARTEAQTPLAMRGSPSIRATVVTYDDHTHLLVVVVSHLALDGWSSDVLRRELIEVYSARLLARPAQLAPVAAHAPDFAAAEYHAFGSGALAAAGRYWASQWKSTDFLVGYEDLPAFLRHRATASVDSTSRCFDDVTSAAIRSAARAQHVTPYIVLRALFTLLLHRYTGKQRIGVWANFANRNWAGMDRAIANCATHHIIVSELGDGTVGDFCKQVHARITAGRRHEALALPALPLFDSVRFPQADTHIVFDIWPSATPAGEEIAVPFSAPAARRWVDFDIRMQDDGAALGIQATFNGSRYASDGVSVMLADLEHLAHRALQSWAQPATELVLERQ